jgi:hypothetical protein
MDLGSIRSKNKGLYSSSMRLRLHELFASIQIGSVAHRAFCLRVKFSYATHPVPTFYSLDGAGFNCQWQQPFSLRRYPSRTTLALTQPPATVTGSLLGSKAAGACG